MTHQRTGNTTTFRASPPPERRGAPAPEIKWYFVDLLNAWGIDPAAFEVMP